MRVRLHQQFNAHPAALPALVAWVAAASSAAGLDRPASLRAELAIEEIATNSIRHGYVSDDDTPALWLTASGDGGVLELVFEDAAAAFDPLADLPCSLSAVTSQQLGGHGRQLVAHLADASRYERREGRNVLHLRFSSRDKVAPG